MLGALAFQESRAGEARSLVTGETLYEPILLAYELTSIARKKARHDHSQLDAISDLLEAALTLDLQWVDVDHEEVLRLAIETSLSTYDASYLHVARVRGVPLVTFDERRRVAYERPR